MYRQFQLRSDDSRMMCWLAEDARLTIGTLITLKKALTHGADDTDGRHWEIIWISRMSLPSPPDTRWKVGGLL